MEASKSEIQAWEYNSTDENEKLAHKYHPNRAIPLSHVHGLGILTWKLDVDNWESDTELKNIRSDRGYKYSEVITVSREAMVDFDARVKGFFKEHMHSQEESRLILDGSGYWDIRDYDDKWIRFYVQKGDLVVLPPGMYHRFTLDTNDYIKALLLFTENPVRTQHQRSDDSAARKLYVEKYLLQQRVKAQ
ncbi:hypothetical protein SELMODRAFT_416854 [Selaginella moellendorffii]|nr:1,2-dihydroxy-3-keto-5-methylthiopentene dioxygenase 2 isoform X2 [Selaginella moellendorffii]XP_024541381.1 1,2-dihydroxy-3-keto-5-methylthiopentene dioxygenase 2 isoform X4 [Selaginella moellendorffii]EFJ22075.1 hypothetical protein SELMODRAFT_416854 [Selaginella moellendorffii]|eukprot:XP_002976965.1 1,2-dihydroxy-3-keto-5-methylthiopentene dioxygenase 2 isoform X2 [Selaginella moellendorffii]